MSQMKLPAFLSIQLLSNLDTFAIHLKNVATQIEEDKLLKTPKQKPHGGN